MRQQIGRGIGRKAASAIIIMAIWAVASVGCTKTQKVDVPVIVTAPKPSPADACRRLEKALDALPKSAGESVRIEQLGKMSAGEKDKLVRKLYAQKLELIERIILDRTQRAIDIDNARTCRHWVMRTSGD